MLGSYTDEYFTMPAYFAERFRAVGRRRAFRAQNLSEYTIWDADTRAALSGLIGLDTYIGCGLNPRRTHAEPQDGYTRERWLIDTEPGVTMPFFALIPAGIAPGEKRAVMLCPHGHAGAGKFSVAGMSGLSPEIAAAISEYNYAYGVQFCRSGYIALCPDARGFGERREECVQGEESWKYLHSSCRELNNMAIPLGQTVTGMWVWDLMRLCDYAISRPDCDGRVGCAGLSGGGQQTLWLAAMDKRICCAVISGYFYGYEHSLLELNGNCSCNYVPHLWETADMGDIGALIAPRPVIIETGSKDPLNGRGGVDNVLSQLAVTRSAYSLLGAADALALDVFDGPHRWNGIASMDFVRKHMPCKI